MLIVFSFDCELMEKLYKDLVFTITHICTFAQSVLRPDVSSLTESQYLQIELSEKGTHANESTRCLKYFKYTHLSDEQVCLMRYRK